MANVSVTDSGGTIAISDGNAVVYIEKTKVDVTAQGGNVTIRWDEDHYSVYAAANFSAPTGTASEIAAAIAAFLNSGTEISGSGTTGYIPKWTASTTLGNSLLFSGTTAIGLGTATPAASSILDINSTTLGVLLPRLTTTQQNAIPSPATGLLIFNSTTGGFQYYTGAAWAALDAGTAPLSSILAATATNTINSGNFAQAWQWNTLAGISAFTLSSTSTAAASNSQNILSILTSGANATATQTTYGMQVTNIHSGTASTNVAGYFNSSGGTNNYGIIVNAGYVGIGTSAPTSTFHLVETGLAGGSQSVMKVTGAANTNQTVSTEVVGVNFNLSATKQWATGAISAQREFVIQAPTYSFVAASTITTAATLAISGAPVAGTNATLTNTYALWVQSGGTNLNGILSVNGSGNLNTININHSGNGVGIYTDRSSTSVYSGSQYATSASVKWLLGPRGDGTEDFYMYNYTINKPIMLWQASSGFLSLGYNVTNPSAVLNVFGSGTTSATTGFLVGNATPTTTFSIGDSGRFIFAQVVETSGSPTFLSITSAAHTGLTASTENIGANFNFSATKQFGTGALTTQREILIQAPTYAFVAASTVTNAATVAISGMPIAGANATLTNSFALWIQTGILAQTNTTPPSNNAANTIQAYSEGAVWKYRDGAGNIITI